MSTGNNATKVSVLQKILTYFELAAAIGMEIPEPHVEAISTLIEELSQDLQKSPLIGGPTQQGPALVTLPAPAEIPAAPAPSSEVQESVSVSESVSPAGSVDQGGQHP